MKDILLEYINTQFQSDDPIEAQDDLLGEGILDSFFGFASFIRKLERY